MERQRDEIGDRMREARRGNERREWREGKARREMGWEKR